MRATLLIPLAAVLATATAPISLAKEAVPAPTAPEATEATEVDYEGFEALTGEVALIREERLLSIEDFTARAAQPGTLVLDTRSAAAFARGHIEGAVNLPFSDFTEESLEKVIGANKGRAILIYCNNNFSDDVAPVMLKKAPLALNIPTFINLIGYGYSNVWELGDTVSLADVAWVSDEVDPLTAMVSRAPANEKAALAQ